MTLNTSNHHHIGMAFAPPALYAPPVRAHDQLAYLHTVHPLPGDAQIDYMLNGRPGNVEGITAFLHPALNGVSVSRAFLSNYTGPWPAILEVRYLRDGEPADLARLPLLDPHAAVATRLHVDVMQRPTVIPPHGSTEVVSILPRLFDAELLPLPFGFGYDIELLDPHPGIKQHDHAFLISDTAVPGDYRVRVTTKWGLEETVTFSLIAEAAR